MQAMCAVYQLNHLEIMSWSPLYSCYRVGLMLNWKTHTRTYIKQMLTDVQSSPMKVSLTPLTFKDGADPKIEMLSPVALP